MKKISPVTFAILALALTLPGVTSVFAKDDDRSDDGQSESRSESRGESRSESRGEGRSDSRDEGRSDSRRESRSESRDERRSDSRDEGRSDSRRENDRNSGGDRARTGQQSPSSASVSGDQPRTLFDAFEGGSGDNEQDTVRNQFRRGNIRKLSEVMAAVNEQVPGDVVSVKLKGRSAAPVYELKILTNKNELKKIRVDARSLSIY
jgi:uncharacterized membrane protein YkoI